MTEDVAPVPRNIYGVTKTAAEDLCELFHRKLRLNCLILRTSRFFPEEDDRKETRQAYDDANIKANEFLDRRVDLEDVVSARPARDREGSYARLRTIHCQRNYAVYKGRSARTRDERACGAQAQDSGVRSRDARRGWRMFPGIDCKVQSEPIYSVDALLAHPFARKYGLGDILDKLPKTPDSVSGCPAAHETVVEQPCR